MLPDSRYINKRHWRSKSPEHKPGLSSVVVGRQVGGGARHGWRLGWGGGGMGGWGKGTGEFKVKLGWSEKRLRKKMNRRRKWMRSR